MFEADDAQGLAVPFQALDPGAGRYGLSQGVEHPQRITAPSPRQQIASRRIFRLNPAAEALDRVHHRRLTLDRLTLAGDIT